MLIYILLTVFCYIYSVHALCPVILCHFAHVWGYTTTVLLYFDYSMIIWLRYIFGTYSVMFVFVPTCFSSSLPCFCVQYLFVCILV